MPPESLIYTGHYVDDELVRNIEEDCAVRIRRKDDGRPMRFLLTIGGAGAQKEIFAGIIRHLFCPSKYLHTDFPPWTIVCL